MDQIIRRFSYLDHGGMFSRKPFTVKDITCLSSYIYLDQEQDRAYKLSFRFVWWGFFLTYIL